MSRRSLCLWPVTLLLLGLSLTLASAASGCPPNFVLIQNACYKFVQERVTADAAEARCQADEATLASMGLLQEKDEVIDHINANFPGQYWTSGSSRSGRYEWADTKTEVPVEWRGRPFREENNMCMYLCSITKMFWDAPCVATRKFICKRSLEERDVDYVEPL